jgi:hypothetical protein
MLFFKYDRSKVFAVTAEMPVETEDYIYVEFLQCFILLAEDFLKEDVEWIGGF